MDLGGINNKLKKLLGILVLGLLWCNSVLAVSLPKDVVSGSKFTKSLTGSYYKKYGMQVVDKKDGHPVRAGEKSIRFEVRIIGYKNKQIKKKLIFTVKVGN